METKVPLRDVSVRWDRNKEVSTLWDGSFTLDSIATDTARTDTCDERTITLSKPGYLERVMQISQITDTIELLPAFNKISEVVVWGKYKPRTMTFSLNGTSQDKLADAKAPSAGASIGVGDIMLGIENLINYKKRKRQKRVKEVLENY